MEYFTPAATSPSPRNDNLRKYLPTRYFLCLLNCGEDILNPRDGVPRFLYSTGVLLQELYLKLWVKLSLNSEINARQIFNVSCNNNSANRSWRWFHRTISKDNFQKQYATSRKVNFYTPRHSTAAIWNTFWTWRRGESEAPSHPDLRVSRDLEAVDPPPSYQEVMSESYLQTHTVHYDWITTYIWLITYGKRTWMFCCRWCFTCTLLRNDR